MKTFIVCRFAERAGRHQTDTSRRIASRLKRWRRCEISIVTEVFADNLPNRGIGLLEAAEYHSQVIDHEVAIVVICTASRFDERQNSLKEEISAAKTANEKHRQIPCLFVDVPDVDTTSIGKIVCALRIMLTDDQSFKVSA